MNKRDHSPFTAMVNEQKRIHYHSSDCTIIIHTVGRVDAMRRMYECVYICMYVFVHMHMS